MMYEGTVWRVDLKGLHPSVLVMADDLESALALLKQQHPLREVQSVHLMAGVSGVIYKAVVK